ATPQHGLAREPGGAGRPCAWPTMVSRARRACVSTAADKGCFSAFSAQVFHFSPLRPPVYREEIVYLRTKPMTAGQRLRGLPQLRQLFTRTSAAGDAALLQRFHAQRDEGAFAE